MVRFGTMTAVVVGALTLAITGPAEAQSSCGSIQSRVNNVAAGGTINLPDNCIYRETLIITKPLTLRGGPGVQIRGSNVWTNWTRSGSYWVKGTVPRFETMKTIPDPQHPYPCNGTARCLWPEQVFFDGRPLTQVASNPDSGQFAVNDARQVVLADDPRGHNVEVTVRQSWILGKSGGVTVEGFTMKHAANGAATAAINNNSHPNWTIQNNDLSWAHGINLALSHASGLSIIGNKIHHAGQLGITSNKASVVARDNEIYDNNTERFYPGWSSGGIKVSGASRLLFDNNRVYANDWNGVWIDNGSKNVTISNNRIHHNLKKGIQFEISDYGKIYGNTVWENGRGASGGGGIQAVSSRNVEIYNNTLAWNRGTGVFVQNADRPQGNGTEYDLVKNVRVHHNTILMPYSASTQNYALDWRKSSAGGNIYNPDAGNRGYDNRYWYAGLEASRNYRFYWNGGLERLQAFNSTLGEERGHYLSSTEKGQVTTAKGIPSVPEP